MDSPRRSGAPASKFSSLLKQLEEERGSGSGGRRVPPVSHASGRRPHQHRCGREPSGTSSLRSASSSLGKSSSFHHRSHEDSELLSAVATNGMRRLQSEQHHFEKWSELNDPLGESLQLHPEWLSDPEDVKLGRNFTFEASWPRISLQGKVIDDPAWGVRTLLHSDRQGQDRSEHACTFVRAPSSRAQMMWDFVGIICIFFDLIWIPLQLGFEPGASDFTTSCEWAVRTFWTLDLLLNCTLAYQLPDGVMERRLVKVACHYVRSRRFCFDSLIVLADWFPTIVSSSSESSGQAGEVFGLLRIGKIPRILRILRILRLARIAKLEHLLFAFRDHLLVSSESLSLSLSMLKNMLFLLLLCHLSACLWHFLGDSAGDDHWTYYHGLYGPEVPLSEKYLWSFHWVATQWTPASMEVLPRNTLEREFNVLLIVTGVMTFSAFMGAITASITRLRSISGNELSQLFLLRRFLHENSISRSLTVRISRYAELALEMHRRKIDKEKVQYLNLLSGPLNIELHKEIYLPHLRMHSFFADYNDWDPVAISHLCFVALARTSVAKGDILFSLGAEAYRMYYPVSGTFVYQRRRGLRIAKGLPRPKRMVRIGKGLWCCEASLWVRWYHFGAMCAMIESDVVEIDAQKFREVTVSRGSVFSRSRRYAKEFAESLCDDHGYAWDVPASLLYPETDVDRSGKLYWWQQEVIDSEMNEAKLWSHLNDSEFESESDIQEDEEPAQPPIAEGEGDDMFSV